jgi:hypothetical protein
MATTPNYYQNQTYNYQPYDYTGTPFGQNNFGADPRGAGPYAPMSQTAPNMGLPATAPTGATPSAGLFQSPNWLYDPEAATIRAMRQAGMNPASFNPMTQQVLRNSGQLVSRLFGQQASAPGDTAPNITDNDAMLGQLSQLIRQATSGQQVLGGFSPDQLASFSRWTAASNAGSADPNVNALAQYLYDPNKAQQLSANLLYGGLAPKFQAAATAPMANLMDYYNRLLEQGQDYNRTIIDVLLGAPVAGRTPGSAGVPLPFQGSAWRYA